jgi:glycine cleavage system aminomethyltransferase T
LKQGIALGFAARGFSKVGTELQIEIRGNLISASVVKPPFVQETSLMA